MCRDRAQSPIQPILGLGAPTPVRELPAGGAEQPRQRVVPGWDILEPAPRHREGLGRHIARLLGIRAPERVAEHAREELVPEPFERGDPLGVRGDLLFTRGVSRCRRSLHRRRRDLART